MVSLAELKARKSNNLEKLIAKSKEEGSKSQGNSKDNRFWRVERGSDGNGFAIIRFLPIPEVDSSRDDALCWVKYYEHAFEHINDAGNKTGRWYIEKSLTSLNQKDPLAEWNKELWDTGDEALRKQVSRQKRKLNYVSNILVVKDPAHPENEGKVFLFRYGKKIFDKLMDVINPDETFGEEPSDPFDFWAGRQFRLKIKTVDGYPNYDASTFDAVGVISDKNGKEYDDAQIEKIYKSAYSLLEFNDPAQYKSYDELKKRLDYVRGINSNDEPVRKSEPKEERKVEAKKEESKPAEVAASSDSGDDEDIDIDALLADIDE